MTSSKRSTKVPTIGHQSNGDWSQTTPGERFIIRTSVEETKGAYTMLEVVADPRNRVPMQIHTNEDEHFIVLAGTLRIANGDTTLDAQASTAITISKRVSQAWCNLTDGSVRMLIIFSPGHIEGLFREVAAGKSEDDIEALADKFGCLIVGPPLDEGIYTIGSPRS